jgi:hypothetical protein
MNSALKETLSSIGLFLSQRRNRCLVYLALICLIALGDYLRLGLVRKTMVFYSEFEGSAFIEERMLRRSGNLETDIRRYIDEVFLGPVTPGLALLFPKETRLHSFMYRDAIVYADLTDVAALPLPEGRDVFQSILTLNEGIRRNFPGVNDVKIFVGGNEVFFEEFREVFANSADNSKTAP